MFNKKIIAISAPQNLQDCFQKWTNKFPIQMGIRDTVELVREQKFRMLDEEGPPPVTIEQLQTEIRTFLDLKLAKYKLAPAIKLDPITTKELDARKLLGRGGQGSVFDYSTDQVVKEIIIGKPLTLKSSIHRDTQIFLWQSSLTHLFSEFYYLNRLSEHHLCPCPSHIEIREVNSSDGTSYVSIGIVMEKLPGSLDHLLKKLDSHEKREALISQTAALLAGSATDDPGPGPGSGSGAAASAVAPGIDQQMIRAALNLFLDDLQYQLARLVDHIHRLHIAHGDLKPGNIGYKWSDEGLQLFALDLGNSCSLTAADHKTGSMPYMDSLTLKAYALELILDQENTVFGKLFFETEFEVDTLRILLKEVKEAQIANQAGPKPYDCFALTRILREIATPDEPVPTFNDENAASYRATLLTLASYKLEHEPAASREAREQLFAVLEQAKAELKKLSPPTKESEVKAPAPKDSATEDFLTNMFHPNRAIRAAYPLMESAYILQKSEAHAILQRPEYAPILAAFKTILTS